MAEIKIYKNGAWENIIGQEFNGNAFKEGDKIYADGKWYEAEAPLSIPLTFTAEEAGSTIYLFNQNYNYGANIQYRLGDTGEWLPYNVRDKNVITLENIGDVVQFQNTEEVLSTDTYAHGYVRFYMTGKIAASGDIQSLLNYSNTCPEYSYYRLFYDCNALTKVPVLSATDLAGACYNQIFTNCTNVHEIKVKFTNWTYNGSNVTTLWVSGLGSTGTFYKPSALPEKYGNDKIPEGWTVVNID